ncbi:MAG: N-6 DNA methylase [Sulfuricaulis sp.]
MDLPFVYRDPASAMAEFEQILASNSGEDPFDSAIKLLAAKLVDESQSTQNQVSAFRIHKTPEITHRTVHSLYRQALKKWPLLNGVGSNLDISPQHLVRSMRPLIGWKLADTDLSLLDATLERLVAKDAKGALGQYFTPRDIVRFCIRVLNPNPKDKVIDPACGSGGFLFEATRHSLEQSGTAPACLGIDFGARAIKVAALLAAAIPKAKITISKANSIDGRSYVEHAPTEWGSFLSRDTGSKTKRAGSWSAWNKLGCTFLATNPPFAGDIDEQDILDAYESQQLSTGRTTVSREHLFLERAIHLLRPQGRLAIVLPQGLLANPSASYLRSWLLKKCRVLGVIGLHPHTFLPYTGVKTALLFAVKLPDNEVPPYDYSIFFATSQDCGKDSRGKATGTADYSHIETSFTRFLASQKFLWAAHPPMMAQDFQDFETVSFSEVAKADRLDAEYYHPTARALLRKLDAKSVNQLGNLVDAKPERFKKSFFKEIRYIDISSVDNKTGQTSPTVISASDAPSRASYIVQPGDVLVSTVRPDRNVVAYISETNGIPTVASNGFCVLRPKNIDPEVLFAYCKTESFKQMLSRHATASMYPTVTDRDVLGIPFLEPPVNVSDRVKNLIRSGLDMIEKGEKQLNEAIALMTDEIQEPCIPYKVTKGSPKTQRNNKAVRTTKRNR